MSEKIFLNVLIALPYCSTAVINLLKGCEDIRFLLDSGAFTAWKLGKTIPIEQYISFVEKLPIKPWNYFTLDKIGDPVGTEENYQKALSAGLRPIPIFTRGENPENLDHLYQHSELVGIGGLVGTPNNRGFVKGIMGHLNGRPCHWLGFAQKNFLGFFKPYSCDSSSFTSASRYGNLSLYRGMGRWTGIRKDMFITKPKTEILSAINEYGIDPRILAMSSSWINSEAKDRVAIKLSCASYVRFSMDLEKRMGTKYFIAISTEYELRMVIDAFNYWRNRLDQ